ncbi:unnamed protein product [Coffea canephora]|uniref:DUF4408 domain-containing protein n=1 Tax=Coffea canephora TaxID=49390 RepID=A0A068UYP9_COFCA|nr:unnamed protein product [Coffea canephora]
MILTWSEDVPMDSIKAHKLQALKNYKRTQFLYNFMVYSLTAFLSTLFYLYLFWFPSMKHFFSIFFPNICSFFLSTKFLFIVGNVIVLFLVGQSKVAGGGSQYSSLAAEIYDEYVRFERSSRSLRERSMRLHEYKKKNKDGKVSDVRTSINGKCMSLDAMSTHVYLKEYEKENETQVETNNSGKAVAFEVDAVEGKLGRREEVKEEEEGDKQEQKPTQVLANDELNRRVEEFIARVNGQRRLEERQVLDRW